MHFFALATAAVSLVSAVSAATITVKVGENNGLTYSPTNVVAAAGDVIAFQFLSKNHTVTQSTFKVPCERMTAPTEGIDSGFQAVAPGAAQIPQWSFTVNNASAPLWFYCAQVGHCSAGMVFSVNAPTTGNTFDAFKATAMGGAATNTTGKPAPKGGAATTHGASAGLVALAAGLGASFLL